MNATDEQVLISIGRVPGGVLVDVQGFDMQVLRIIAAMMTDGARREKLACRMVSHGPTALGAYSFTLRIAGITQEQAAMAVERQFDIIGQWETFDIPPAENG